LYAISGQKSKEKTMTKVFTSPNLAETQMMQGILEDHAIPCVMRDHSNIPNGEIPFTDNWPEVWVLRESDAGAARLLLSTPAPVASEWRCPHCGEENEGQFTACWNCSQDRPLAGAGAEGA